ncbi:MAG: AAA family ATPase [Burkholderiales bacterium]|nr:AAA family ATPase [Burkholderiales bacterium]
MYLKHFALTEAPFSIAPDPRYLYMSKRHQEALAHLLYGLSGEGGFVVLTGEVGAGKTTVCRCLLEQVPDNCDLAYIFNPKLTVEDLLATLCTEFHITVEGSAPSLKQTVDAINDFLLAGHAKGRHAVVIIDEAQNLSSDVLEQMRLLTNLETHQRKLLQIILIGQPELATMLASQSLRQLAQRVVARYHLDPLSRDEVAAYIKHRLDIAGATRPLFPSRLVTDLYRLSGGVPRVLNLICDRALLGAYVEGKHVVDGRVLKRAAQEVFAVRTTEEGARRAVWMTALAAIALMVVGFALWQRNPKLASAQAAPAAPTKMAALPRPAKSPAAPTLPASTATSIQWPAGVDRAQSRQLAFAELYASWGHAVPDKGPCADGAPLRCRTARGSLEELRAFDRPAVLYLVDERGMPLEATLVALDDAHATLVIGGQRERLPFAALAGSWSGRYSLLWRAPIPYAEQIRLGDKGGAVDWLAGQLASSAGKPAQAVENVVFDEALRQSIRAFQLNNGLTPDGQVGLQTMIKLSVAGDANAPSLRHAHG